MNVWAPEVGNTADTPMSPLVYYPIKRNLGVPIGQRKSELGGVWTRDLRIAIDALPPDLRGQYTGAAGRGNLHSESP